MNTRYNPFCQIHKALRHALAATLQQLQQANAVDHESTAAVEQQITELIDMFEGHAHTEDTLFFPIVAQHAPDVVATIEAQHAEDHRLGQELQQALDAFVHATKEERAHAMAQLLYSFSAFTAFNLNHMNEEELHLNPILWQVYSDDELMAFSAEVIKNIPPDKNAIYRKWMLRALSLPEIETWYAAVRQSAPAFVWHDFVEMAYRELPESKTRWLFRHKAA
jgi:hemerythrin-like domain-containing protein